jgi:hypothetical protein
MPVINDNFCCDNFWFVRIARTNSPIFIYFLQSSSNQDIVLAFSPLTQYNVNAQMVMLGKSARKGGADMANPILKPGTLTPESGQYVPVGPRGGRIGNREITSVEGKPLPPTQKPGGGYVIVDPTKHAKR